MNSPQTNPVDLLNSTLNFTCPICFFQYNDSTKKPMIVCTNQHILCLQCADQVIFKDTDTSRCPICKITIHWNNIIVFRFLLEMKEISNQLNLYGSRIMETKQELEQQKRKNQLLAAQYQKENQKIRQNQKKIQTQQHINQTKRQIITQKNRSISFSVQTSSNLKIKANFQIEPIQSKQKQKSNDQDWLRIKQLQNLSGSFSFTYLIIKLVGNMKLGIRPVKYYQSSIGLQNRRLHSMYLGSNGKYYNGQEKIASDSTYKTGDIVTVNYDVSRGDIYWFVNNQLELTLPLPQYIDSNTKWFSSVTMKKDCIIELLS